MFKTNQGVIDNEANLVYLRPETAQGIFINFKNIQRTTRENSLLEWASWEGFSQ